MPEDDLDALLAEDAPPMPLEGEADEATPEEDDEFAMHAESFLDDSLPMEDRIEALRSAILAAKSPIDLEM